MSCCLQGPSNAMKCYCVIIFQQVVWNFCGLCYAFFLLRHCTVAASCLKRKENILIRKSDCIGLYKGNLHNEVDLLLYPFYFSSTMAPPSLQDNKTHSVIQIVL